MSIPQTDINVIRIILIKVDKFVLYYLYVCTSCTACGITCPPVNKYNRLNLHHIQTIF